MLNQTRGFAGAFDRRLPKFFDAGGIVLDHSTCMPLTMNTPFTK